MKQIYFILMLSLILFNGCKDESLSSFSTDKTPQQIVGENISGTWARPKNIKTPVGVRGDIVSLDMRLLIRVSNEGDGAFYAYKVPMFFKQEPTTWSWLNETTMKDILVAGEENAISKLKLELFEDSKKLKVSFAVKWTDTSNNSGEGDFEFDLERL